MLKDIFSYPFELKGKSNQNWINFIFWIVSSIVNIYIWFWIIRFFTYAIKLGLQ